MSWFSTLIYHFLLLTYQDQLEAFYFYLNYHLIPFGISHILILLSFSILVALLSYQPFLKLIDVYLSIDLPAVNKMIFESYFHLAVFVIQYFWFEAIYFHARVKLFVFIACFLCLEAISSVCSINFYRLFLFVTYSHSIWLVLLHPIFLFINFEGFIIAPQLSSKAAGFNHRFYELR